MTSFQNVVTSSLFFQLTNNLEPSESWIPTTESVKLIFPLIVTFYLTKIANRTKKSELNTALTLLL